ncbi:rRNA maturation RNase YbeY [Paracoccaceae bacterium]|nr:rRNA maturation RNase YbeY [Paracoccaceae bacterium]
MVKVSVNYHDPRWRRFDLSSYAKFLVYKVIQLHQMRLNNFSLSVLACGDTTIRELNRQHRKKNKVTNVLAWPSLPYLSFFDKSSISKGIDNYLFLGDIAISYETCLREARFHNIQLNRYCYKLLVHSILHLLGYDHDISVRTLRMQLMERRVLNSVLTNRPKLNSI